MHSKLLLMCAVVFLLYMSTVADSMKMRLPSLKLRRPNQNRANKNRVKMPVFLKLSNGDAVPVYPLPGNPPPGLEEAGDPHVQSMEDQESFSVPRPEHFFGGGLGASPDVNGAGDTAEFGPPQNIQAKFSSMMPEHFDEGEFAKSFGDSLPDFPNLAAIFDDSASFSGQADISNQQQRSDNLAELGAGSSSGGFSPQLHHPLSHHHQQQQQQQRQQQQQHQQQPLARLGQSPAVAARPLSSDRDGVVYRETAKQFRKPDFSWMPDEAATPSGKHVLDPPNQTPL